MSAYPPSEPLPASAEGMQPQIYKINSIPTNPNSFLFSCSLVVSWFQQHLFHQILLRQTKLKRLDNLNQLNI